MRFVSLLLATLGALTLVGASADAGAAGLGLSIARQLAEAQGGRVEYSARLGGGSIFTFEIPGANLETEEGGN